MKKLKPMLATLIDEPFDDSEWLFEIKFDGYRAITETYKNEEPDFYSRNFISFKEQYQEIYRELKKFSIPATFDGEIVVLNEKGVSDFQLLQDYKLNPNAPLFYYIFDLMELNGKNIEDLPLIERKKKLKKLLEKLTKKHSLKKIRYSDHVLAKGINFFKLIKERDLEGMMAKKIDSKYLPGKRTKTWLKIKREHRQETIICGYTEGKGSRQHFGALILGIYKNTQLKYIGHTGSGFDENKLKEIKAKLKKLERKTSPFENSPKTNAPVTWVNPQLVCEIKFSQWTREEIMRQPVFVALREDKKAEEVIREIPQISQSKTSPSFTNLDKILWPEKKYTKEDLINYYDKIAPIILPYLKDRPLTLHRHPNGIHAQSFYQKDIGDLKLPDWITTAEIYSESTDTTYNGIICNNKETLLYLANLGCMEMNPWNGTIKKPDYPTYMVFDLDPEGIKFEKCIKTAQKIKEILDKLDIPAYIKTSGKRGLHIYVPAENTYSTKQIRTFAQLIAQITAKDLNFISLERKPEKRKNHVYIDYLQNRKHQTMVAPYCLRATVEATVSTPLHWSELKKNLDPKKFTIKTIFKHIEKHGDPFKPVMGKGFNMEKSLKKLENLP